MTHDDIATMALAGGELVLDKGINACPVCQHPLYHQSPPLLKPPPWRVYCDGCKGWLAWEPTSETRKAGDKAPLCPACRRPMALKNLKAGGTRYGCETWKKCGTGMRSGAVEIDVPVYRLVARTAAAGGADERAERFGELWEEAQGRYEAIEARENRWKRWWER